MKIQSWKLEIFNTSKVNLIRLIKEDLIELFWINNHLLDITKDLILI